MVAGSSTDEADAPWAHDSAADATAPGAPASGTEGPAATLPLPVPAMESDDAPSEADAVSTVGGAVTGTGDEPEPGTGPQAGAEPGEGSGSGRRKGRRRGTHRGATRPTRSRRRRRRSIIGAAAAGMVVVLGVLGLVALASDDGRPQAPKPSTAGPRPDTGPAPGPAGQPAAPEPTPQGPAAPGARWPTGTNANPPLDIRAWEAWTGRPTDIATVFTVRNNWEHIAYSDWPFADYRPEVYAGQLSVAQPLFPQSGDERTCSRGHYDQHWAAFGQTLTRNGRPDAIVRLGWEYNGNWFWWYPRDTATWKTCFQHAATAIRSTAPGVRIEFNVSAHRDRMPNGDDVWAAYPGDEFVDIVSSDTYDSYPPSLTPELFEQQCIVPSGTCTVAAFARAHGKQFAVPEWGLVRADRHGGGDNPLYIEKMHDLFERNRDILAYEAYFNAAEATNVRSSLINPPLHPNAAQRYLELFGTATTDRA